jgi:hypothetical protein
MKIEKHLKRKVFEYCDSNKNVNIKKVCDCLTELSEQEW